MAETSKIQGQLMQAVNDVIGCFKKSYDGRAMRREFWCFQIFAILVEIVLLLIVAGAFRIHEWVGIPFAIIAAIIMFILLLCNIAVCIRRFHDVGLTGFWLVYLLSFGLPLIYISSVLDIDPVCTKVAERIGKVGYPWLGWLLALLSWNAAPIILLFIFLYPGKKEDNQFGPNPYKD